MSSPHSAPGKTTAGPNRTASPHRRVSLTLWFTVWNALSAFLLISFISAAFYFVLSEQLLRQNHRHLHHELKSLLSMVVLDGSVAPLMSEAGADPEGEVEYIRRYVRFLEPNGRILFETPGMRTVIPSRIFPVAEKEGVETEDRSWHNRNGRRLLATAILVKVPGRSQRGVLQVALDVTHVDEVLAGCRDGIYLALLLGLVLSVGNSLTIARRGVRPLKEMSEVVRRVTVTNLEERIAPGRWPREFDVMAESLNLMLHRLEDSFRRLHLSARNLSHKMRTPLTILRGEAEVALSGNRTVEELEDVIASSLEEITRLSRLGDNILFLANAEMGKYQLELDLLDAREEVETVVDYHSPFAEEQGVTISFEGEASVVADGRLFRKLVALLLSNAVTYNSPGGTVAVSLRQRNDLSAELRVTDTGCGIPPEEMRKIFDRFYRIYGTRHRDPHGTGLGLPLAKAIMDLHGGRVTVESVPGEMTTVTAIFPHA